MTIYESLIDIVAGQPKVGFSEVSYSLATEEAERVGVDHIAKETVTSGGQTSTVTDHLTAHYGAIKMLHTRILVVVDYLKAVEKGLWQIPSTAWSISSGILNIVWYTEYSLVY